MIKTKESHLNKYTPEETANLRSLFMGWRDEHHGPAVRGNPLHENPHFRESLHQLIHVHGYSLPEVAEWLGITRAWLTMLMTEAGIPRPARKSQYRYWDGEMFRPREPEYLKRLKTKQARVRRDYAQKAIYDGRMARAVVMLQCFASHYGRVPYVREIMDQLEYEHHQAPVFAFDMGSDSHDTVATFFDNIWKQAGFERPDGRACKWSPTPPP